MKREKNITNIFKRQRNSERTDITFKERLLDLSERKLNPTFFAFVLT